MSATERGQRGGEGTPEEVLTGRARWALVPGEWESVLPALTDRSIDHVISDPPYAARALKNFRSASMVQRRDGVVRDFGYADLTPEQRRQAARVFARIVRRWIVLWTDIESTGAWRVRLERAGARYVRTAAWLRDYGAPQFSGDRPAQDVEACVIAHAPGEMRWNGGGHGASRRGPIVNSNAAEREHSSPKPLWLMLDQVDAFTDPDDVVVDPYAGSGTTGVACLRRGRRFIGFERVPKFATLARDALLAEERGLPLRAVHGTTDGQRPLFAGL